MEHKDLLISHSTLTCLYPQPHEASSRHMILLIYLTVNMIIPLSLVPTSCLFPSYFPTKTQYLYILSATSCIILAHLFLLVSGYKKK